MFRQLSTVVLMAFTALGSLAIATAEESKEASGTTKGRPKEIAIDLGRGLKLEMVPIPAGEFLMGSPDSDKDSMDWEKPQHRVRITERFVLFMNRKREEKGEWQASAIRHPHLRVQTPSKGVQPETLRFPPISRPLVAPPDSCGQTTPRPPFRNSNRWKVVKSEVSNNERTVTYGGAATAALS